jgi:polyisoprenyl-phosphate glycosyltransferase
MKKVSIVIPIYNEEKNIPLIIEALEGVFKSLSYEWEVICINDGSKDESLNVLRKFSQKKKNIKVLDFSRNFGKEVATSAGCHYAWGDAVITMDADLQHPPESIPQFLSLWEAGAEVVYTVRKETQGVGWFKKLSSRLFYWVFNRISDTKSESGTTDFRLMDKKVIEAFRSLPERERMFRGLIDWMGFRRERLEFVAGERKNGVAQYSYGKLFRLALNSFTSFSLFPLRLAGYLGILITIISGSLLFIMLLTRFLDAQVFTPLAIVAVSTMFLIGIVLMCLGLIALYIARIHTEVSGRPLYIIREVLDGDKKK